MAGWRIGLAAVMMTGVSAAALAAPAEAPNPAFTGSDLFGLTAASDPQFHFGYFLLYLLALAFGAVAGSSHYSVQPPYG